MSRHFSTFKPPQSPPYEELKYFLFSKVSNLARTFDFQTFDKGSFWYILRTFPVDNRPLAAIIIT
jgi:hypothetical protein